MEHSLLIRSFYGKEWKINFNSGLFGWHARYIKPDVGILVVRINLIASLV